MIYKNTVFLFFIIFIGKTLFPADQSSSELDSCQGLSSHDSTARPTQVVNAIAEAAKYHVQLENNSDYYVTLASQEQRSVVLELSKNKKIDVVLVSRPCEAISLSRGKTTFSTKYACVNLKVVELGVNDKVLYSAPFQLKHHTKISIDRVGSKIDVRFLENRCGASNGK